MVSRWFIRRRGRAVGLIYLAGAAGNILGIQIASLVISHWSISAAWIALGIVVVAVSVLPAALLIVERPEDLGLEPDGFPPNAATSLEKETTGSPTEPNQGEIDWTLREAMGTKALWVLTGVVGALFLIQAGVSVHIGAFFRDQGLSLTLVATAITINGIVNAIGSLVWGATIERVPVGWAMGLLMVITAGSTIALSLIHI